MKQKNPIKWKRSKAADVIYHTCNIPQYDVRICIALCPKEVHWQQVTEIYIGENRIGSSSHEVENESIKEFEARNLDGRKWNVLNTVSSYFSDTGDKIWRWNNTSARRD